MKFLIAEDNQFLQELNISLMTIRGYDFDIVSNGKEAVKHAQKNEGKYDLCLMDIDMPLMNGYEATKIIRKKVKYFPIMALTANVNIEDKYLEAGMDDFLEKPYRLDKLCAKINELTVKAVKLHNKQNQISLIKEMPMNQDELRELRELKKKGLTKLKLVGTGHTFVVHRNIQNKISHDLISDGKELSEFIDQSKKDPGRCHLYKKNLHVTKDLFIPDELEEAIQKEDQIAIRFDKVTDKKLPE
ncbi:MAG TPA: response regulator [Nitrospinota bacterium]|jgi:CheY-like chemotaxis protein|nr:response regulator [Nitrospinota bacterium]|tara:strand:+ start:1865 stop:2596 length:732 start_codon:yes stop_codon:yes gene_type:complete